MSSNVERRVAVPVQSPVHAHGSRPHPPNASAVRRSTRMPRPCLPTIRDGKARPRRRRVGDPEPPGAGPGLEFVGVDDDAVLQEVARDDTAHDQAHPAGGRRFRRRPPVSVEPRVEHTRAPSGSPDGDDRAVDRPARGLLDVEHDSADETAAATVVPAEAQPRLAGRRCRASRRRGDGRRGSGTVVGSGRCPLPGRSGAPCARAELRGAGPSRDPNRAAGTR